MILPVWYDKIEIGMRFKNAQDLANYLGITIRPGTNDKQRLMQKVKRYFVIEFLPPRFPNCKRSNEFKIVERKEVNMMMVTISMEEYEEFKKLKSESKEK